jgi:radical SAM protein
MGPVDYDKTPFVTIWETTQACDLVCNHCRAAAQPDRHSAELSTEEGKRLLDDIAAMGTPIFVLSGGDPLKRPDLFDLIRHGADRHMRMATIPAATAALTLDIVRRLKDSGLSQMAQSLDFPTAELHDEFRGVPGAYAKTMQALEWAHACELPVQINTTLTAGSLPHLEAMIELVQTLGIVFWEVFFLVPMGRGEQLQGLTAAQCEETFDRLYRLQKKVSFLVKVTEAPHYRRYVAQREWEEEGRKARERGAVDDLPTQLIRTEGPGHSIGLASRGVNSGNGFMFISHTGDVYPSGFLPIAAGNVRTHSIASIYRDSELFRQLRRPDEFHGACSICEFNAICGGSRSRALALTGDYLATDPWCAYKPRGQRAQPALP